MFNYIRKWMARQNLDTARRKIMPRKNVQEIRNIRIDGTTMGRPDMSPLEKLVFSLIKTLEEDSGSPVEISMSALAQTVSSSYQAIARIIPRLVDLGEIRVTKNGRHNVYSTRKLKAVSNG